MSDNIIQGLDVLNYSFLYSLCGDDTTFFLQNIDSIREVVRTFQEFFSDLTPNMSKSEIVGIGCLRAF